MLTFGPTCAIMVNMIRKVPTKYVLLTLACFPASAITLEELGRALPVPLEKVRMSCRELRRSGWLELGSFFNATGLGWRLTTKGRALRAIMDELQKAELPTTTVNAMIEAILDAGHHVRGWLPCLRGAFKWEGDILYVTWIGNDGGTYHRLSGIQARGQLEFGDRP